MIKVSGVSHVGNKYNVNEDKIGWDKGRGLYFVADGMGGHVGGEVASGIASATILSPFAPSSLLESIMQAHSAIFEASEADTELRNMGSTVVASKIEYDKCELCWVGDSRAYLWRANQLEQVTEDHSLVQVMVKSGEISPEQARTHKYKNVVVQTLGINTPVPGRVVLKLLPGDWLILCSDGLTDELDDGEISSTLAASRKPARAAHALLEEALSKVGRDNISIMILGYDRYNWSRIWAYLIGAVALGALFWYL